MNLKERIEKVFFFFYVKNRIEEVKNILKEDVKVLVF